MQIESIKSYKATKSNVAQVRRTVRSVKTIKAEKTVSAVLKLLGVLCILFLAMLSDAECIGKAEMLFGVLLGVALQVGGVYLHKAKIFFALLVKHIVSYIKILGQVLAAGM